MVLFFQTLQQPTLPMLSPQTLQQPTLPILLKSRELKFPSKEPKAGLFVRFWHRYSWDFGTVMGLLRDRTPAFLELFWTASAANRLKMGDGALLSTFLPASGTAPLGRRARNRQKDGQPFSYSTDYGAGSHRRSLLRTQVSIQWEFLCFTLLGGPNPSTQNHCILGHTVRFNWVLDHSDCVGRNCNQGTAKCNRVIGLRNLRSCNRPQFRPRYWEIMWSLWKSLSQATGKILIQTTVPQ